MNSGPILVATDLSARSDRPIDRALTLGSALDREVVVIHARKYGFEVEQAEGEALVRAVLPASAEDVRIMVSTGSPPEVIAEAATQTGAALLCVGPARYNAIGDFFLGNAVDYIARYSEVPLLVVKTRAHGNYDKIVFATDFSDCSRRALLTVANLFPETRITLVHGFSVPFPSRQTAAYVREEIEASAQAGMDEFVASVADNGNLLKRLSSKIAFGHAHQAILTQKEGDKSILAAFGTHGESGLRHATIGSVANRLLNTLPVDSLIVKPLDT